jgi:hypothetical protein
MAGLMTFQERNVKSRKTIIKAQTEGEKEFMKTSKEMVRSTEESSPKFHKT